MQVKGLECATFDAYHTCKSFSQDNKRKYEGKTNMVPRKQSICKNMSVNNQCNA
jgi:hypothetical protein